MMSKKFPYDGQLGTICSTLKSISYCICSYFLKLSSDGGVLICVHNSISANDFGTKNPRSCHVGSTPCPISFLLW